MKTRIGIISDTHMPERCLALPDTLKTIFDGVDFILHAGDVGELWVLDQLSEIAPVIAVHGNDDSAESQAELPYQQIIAINGQRILLWHSHFPDRDKEMAFRRINDKWARILDRSANRANEVGASIAIFGHIHIPLVWEQDGVLIINPGALASGNFQLKMLIQTVAVLEIHDETISVQHFDLKDGSIHEPQVAWDAGFSANIGNYQAQLLKEPILFPRTADFWGDHGLRQLMRRVAIPCWLGEKDAITAQDYWDALETDTAINEVVKQQFRDALAPYL